MKPKFFASGAGFRAWLEHNHAGVTELWLGLYKKASGQSGVTYKEAVDEALCFGWIDGLVRRIDTDAYMQRFTPRRRGSKWSNLNVAHVKRLTAAGKMQAAGRAAFEARSPSKTGVYAFERKTAAQLPPEFERKFRSSPQAWAFFTAQAPSYQRTAIHKVISPKQLGTRERWLARLIGDSQAGRRMSELVSTATAPAGGGTG